MADIRRCNDPADPKRCQAVNANGQCNNRAAEGSTFCLAHGGNKAQESAQKAALRNYRKSKWLGRIHEHADGPAIKSLREEIGILRIILEEHLDKCNTEMDLILHSQAISDLVMKIEHIVVSCHKLEDKLKLVVDRSALLQFASMVIDIVASELAALDDSEALLTKISDGILAAIGKIGESDDL